MHVFLVCPACHEGWSQNCSSPQYPFHHPLKDSEDTLDPPNQTWENGMEVARVETGRDCVWMRMVDDKIWVTDGTTPDCLLAQI